MKIKMFIGGLFLSAIYLNSHASENPLPSSQALSPITDEVSFSKNVQPILHDYCLSCHSPGGKGYIKSGLDMTSYQGLMKGTKFGKVVIPGNSQDSTFTKLLTGTNNGLKMPMGLNSTGTLAHQYILVLRKWVNQGAKNN